MASIAQLYYREKKNQTQIAEQYGISHATVSRILAEAQNRGLVEIVIHYPWMRDHKLEAELRDLFGLSGVRVLDSEGFSQPDVLEGTGMLAAEVVDEHVNDGVSIAVSRGRGVYWSTRCLSPHPNWKIDIVQLQGALEDELSTDKNLSSLFSDKYDAQFHVLHAPMILDDEDTQQTLLKKPLIKNVLELARQAKLALVGVGTLDLKHSNHYISGEMNKEEILVLQKEGFVGDICGLHFDSNGVVPKTSINKRIICIDEDSLKQIPLVIGVGVGESKAIPIQAALRGGFLDFLVTDSIVANRLIEWNI
jgi:DNA-binding transcriptional regulator LsrR (DeoR family)